MSNSLEIKQKLSEEVRKVLEATPYNNRLDTLLMLLYVEMAYLNYQYETLFRVPSAQVTPVERIRKALTIKDKSV